MARPIKSKIDYFPIDCTDDDRMKLIELKHGLVAYAVYVKLLQKIFGNKGYYIEWNEDSQLLFSGEYSVPFDTLSDIIADMLKRGIFDMGMYDNYGILTSKDIQEQYFFVVSRRKVKDVDERFCLINAAKTGVIAAKTMVSADNNTHSIGEESIVKDSISEYSIGEESRDNCVVSETPSPSQGKARGEYNNVFLTEAEYEELSRRYPDIDSSIHRLSEYLAVSGKDYASHFAVLNKWSREDQIKQAEKNNSSPAPQSDNNSSYDIDEFYKAALRRSYPEDIVEYLTG